MIILLLHRLGKKIGAALLVGVLGLSGLAAPRAEAVDAWAAAAQALGVFGIYKSTLASVLSLGNNAQAQLACLSQDEAKNGTDRNPNDLAVVNSVMEQLVTRGDYVLRANSLPFIWHVNNSQEFNAACYPTNYISVNRALVRGLNLDHDELAAVLAHEMTHGLEQHSASNYAQAVAQYYGMSFLNMDMGLMNWQKLNALANYSIAKNVTLPTEYDADEGGFYILTSAGFNPGAGAAAMARMGHYLTYETQNVLEHQYFDEKESKQENYNDHPDTDKREAKLAQMMTDYSAGHVAVVNKNEIHIDGERLLTVDWTTEEFDNTPENAYYTAGAIAKAFHDYDSIDGWHFRADGAGGVTCLAATRVNRTLQDFLAKTKTGEKLRAMVTRAYEQEKTSGARDKLRAAEKERADKMATARAEALAADKKLTKKMRENGDVYVDNVMTGKALFQLDRAFHAANVDSESDNYAIRGRAKAFAGDYAGGLADFDRAIALDANNVYIYLNRADVYHMQGDTTRAIADAHRAQEVDSKNIYGYTIAGQVYDEIGDHANALAEYKKLYEVNAKVFRLIPEEYLQEVSEKDYKTLRSEKERARKVHDEALKAAKDKQDKEKAKEKAKEQATKSQK